MVYTVNKIVRIPAFTIIGLMLATACSDKRFTKPRSEIMAESEKSGLTLPTPEEDRMKFFAAEDLQKKKLLTLLEKRAQEGARDANYKIGAQDEIEINVFDVPEMNVVARVGQGGFISLPLVGAVQAGGLNETELKESLAKRLAEYVKNPQVSVFISAYGSQKVAVLGAVRKPGTIPLKKGSNSVLELLSQAGGVSDKSGNFLTFIPAEVSGISAQNDVEARARLALATEQRGNIRDTGIDVYLDQVLGTYGGIPLEIPVRGGDMVIVPEAGKIMIEGEVHKTGAVDLGPQTTLLGALAAAGGITYGAKIDEIEIVRDIGFEDKSHLIIDLQKIATGEEKDVRLRNSDLVRVPSASGRRLAQDTFDGITKIINFGVGGSVNLVP